MFQFTREIIVNPGKEMKLITDSVSGEKGLFISHVGTYMASKITKLLKVAYRGETKDKKTIAYSTPTANDIRLEIRVGLVGDVEASYANAYTWFNKPLTICIHKGTDIDGAVNLINSVLSKSDHPFLKVTKESTKIAIEATDCYQRILDIKLEKFVPRSASFPYEGTYEDLKATVVTVSNGDEGHGTPWQILKNLRLPTIENLKFAGLNQEENPIPGQEYTLYEITYNSGPRNIGGFDVVGQEAKSITTHRFWMAKGMTADVDGTPTAIDTVMTSLVTPPSPTETTAE